MANVGNRFPQTSWTLLDAVREGGEDARPALEELTRRYYRPAYAYIAAILRDQSEAEDLTQDFFTAKLCTGRLFADADQEHKRFEQEIRIMKELSHRNVVRFVDTGISNDGKPYILTEYIRTGCLGDAVLADGGRLNVAYAVQLIGELLDGLEYIHGQDVIHRDIKPLNILLHRELHTGHTHILPKLADFGLAVSYVRAGGTRFTKPKTYMGSLMYSSPEQVRDVRTVEEALRALMKLRRIMHPLNIILSEEPVPIRKRDPAIPHKLAEVVDRAVRKDPKARFQSAAEFRSALQQEMGR